MAIMDSGGSDSYPSAFEIKDSMQLVDNVETKDQWENWFTKNCHAEAMVYDRHYKGEHGSADD